MISIEQLNGEIAVLEEEKPTYVVMQKLADLYTVRDHLVLNSQPASPVTVISETIPEMNLDTMFYKSIVGKNIQDVVRVMDELMITVQVTNPKLYNNVLEMLNETH